jgi:hypothetical protein
MKVSDNQGCFSAEIRLHPSVNREGRSVIAEKKKTQTLVPLKKVTSTIDREY